MAPLSLVYLWHEFTASFVNGDRSVSLTLFMTLFRGRYQCLVIR